MEDLTPLAAVADTPERLAGGSSVRNPVRVPQDADGTNNEEKGGEEDGDEEDGGEEATRFDVVRREFLYSTALNLAATRVRSVRDLKRAVDELGVTLDRLGELRAAIEHAAALHANLETALNRDLGRASEVMKKYEFQSANAVVTGESFASVIERVVDMFMIDIVADNNK